MTLHRRSAFAPVQAGRIALAIPPLLAALISLAQAQVFRDEIVPEGHWALEIARFEQRQDSAFDRYEKLRSLRSYLLPDRKAYEAASGHVERDVSETDLRLTYGFTDRFNLFIELPYLELNQDSSLTTSSTRDLFIREAETFESQSLSGFGDARVLLMHRLVFSDRNAFIWGYGLSYPISDRSESEPGLYALALSSPNPKLLSFFHYTRYPRAEHTRFDLRVEAQSGLTGEIETLEAGTQNYRSGTGATVEAGYYFEGGPLGLGLSLQERYLGQSKLSGIGQSDRQSETVVRGQAGYGNLSELEQGPLSFPYQVRLILDRSLRGYNVPYRDGVALSILFLF